jgi:nitroreductase
MAANPGPARRQSVPEERSDHFFEVVARQRACRDFSDHEVPDLAMNQLLTAATRAPSAMNHQPWVFVVVRSQPARTALAEIMWELWDAAGRAATVGRVPDRLLRDVDDGFRTSLRRAPVMVVVAGDTDTAPLEQLGWSVYPAVQNLLLAATALGLGSVLTTMALFRATDVQAVVGLPPALVPMAIVPIGWPARPLGRAVRAPVAAKAHRERFGQPWTPNLQ